MHGLISMASTCRAAEQPAEHMHMHEAPVAFPAPDNEKQLGEEKLRSGCKDRSASAKKMQRK